MLIVLAATGLVGVLTASTAQAGISAASHGLSADGYFYAARDAYGKGPYCRWSTSDPDWSTCNRSDGIGTIGGMRNRASQIFNNTNKAVIVYWGLNYTGAWRCLPPGKAYDDLSRWGFPPNGDGDGETMDDNISSHKMVARCP
ncbi:peptidase inhibitor family I36 protein [Nonomuraea sp. B19D2]|uniref:peptidase inhibitor family I36 protein n=1 Tax=Nonomuraea sp. B19D2 TaxID=3159561 RepID=UPI0032DBB05D